MQQHGGRLRELLDDEADRGHDDLSPAGEPAIRAHLRLVAEALAATAGPATRVGLEELARELPSVFDDADEELDRELDLLSAAATHELGLQFANEPTADDPSIRDMTARRLRVQAWTRFFLRQVEGAVADDRFREEALAWMAARQEQLANTIFAMDKRAKEAEIARHGPAAVDDPALVNQIGQAAMLQAHTRFLVEATGAVLSRV